MYARATQITATGRSVCDIAEDVRIAARDWHRGLENPGAALRMGGATEALEAMRDAWMADFGVYHDVLVLWCQAAKAAAAGFTSVDDYNAGQFNNIDPRVVGPP
jgi:hypothetical protein